MTLLIQPLPLIGQGDGHREELLLSGNKYELRPLGQLATSTQALRQECEWTDSMQIRFRICFQLLEVI